LGSWLFNNRLRLLLLNNWFRLIIFNRRRCLLGRLRTFFAIDFDWSRFLSFDSGLEEFLAFVEFERLDGRLGLCNGLNLDGSLSGSYRLFDRALLRRGAARLRTRREVGSNIISVGISTDYGVSLARDKLDIGPVAALELAEDQL